MNGNLASRVWACLKPTGTTILAMSGILVDKLDRLRAAALFVVVLSLLLLGRSSESIGTNWIVIYFAAVFVVRYIILFASFVPNGIAERLIRRFGEARAFHIYQCVTALLFIHRGISFGLLVERTSNAATIFGNDLGFLFTGAGVTLIAMGTVVNVWSALVIGIDAYYYKDLFVGRFLSDFKQDGPYRYFANPMYGIGQTNAYGSALLAGSIVGVAVTALNQICMYVFYYLIEKRHIERLTAGAA